jgi:DNA-binding response OmpR family regulator
MKTTSAGRSPARLPGRILVVEDDPEAALFAVHVLAKRGQFEVTHTPDPAVALRLAAAGGFDLVLTDVDMPGMSGLELPDALRRMAPTLPVAVPTGHAHLRADALLHHADEFLVKPVRVSQLLATATALTERATGRQAAAIPCGTLRGTPGPRGLTGR